jgi:hypothetical protein
MTDELDLPICMCVRCTCLWVVCRQPTDKYTGHTHTHTDGIQSHTEKANDEASSGKVVNAVSTKDNP